MGSNHDWRGAPAATPQMGQIAEGRENRPTRLTFGVNAANSSKAPGFLFVAYLVDRISSGGLRPPPL